jgi:ribosomal protein S18 acetylase RimI-like enzyme
MKLTKHAATDRDVAFLVDTFLHAMRTSITSSRGDWDESRERMQFLEQLQIPHTWIIWRGDVKVGFWMAMECGNDLELHTLCIAPEYQRQGVGTAVTRQLLDEARGRGCGVVVLVLKANTEARKLYERLGFVVTEESDNHFRMCIA